MLRGRRRWVLCLAAAAAAVAWADEAPIPSPLTVAGALELFDRRGFDVLLAEAAAESARADTLSAGAVPNPSLTGSMGGALTYDPTQCTAQGCSTISWGLGLQDNGALFDTLWGKRGARVRVAEAAWAAAKLSRDDARRTLHVQLAAALVEVVRATLALEANQLVSQRLGQVVDLNRVRYQSGAISEADLAKAETEKLAADEDVDRAVLAASQAKISVAFLLGVRGPLPSFEVERSQFNFTLFPTLSEAGVEPLLALALERRPDLKAAAAQIDRAAAAIDGAQRQVLPDVQLGPQFSMLGYGQQAINPPVVGLGVSVGLPAFYQYQGELAKARADQDAQRISREKIRAQVVADVQSAWAGYRSARTRLERMHGSLLDRARRTRDLVEIQYKKGAASLLELLDAERQLVSVNLQYVQDLSDYWTAIFQLEGAVGTEVRR